MEPAPQKSNRRWLWLAMKLLIVALLVWGVRGTLTVALDKLADAKSAVEYRIRPGWLAAAGGLYLLGILPCGLFWRRALVAVGQPAGLLEALRAYYIGHLGKYVPGKAMVVVLRTALVQRPAGGTAAVAVTVFYETMTMMAVGAVLGAAVLAIGFRQHIWLALLAAAAGVAAAVSTLPPVFLRLAHLMRVGRAGSETAQRLAGLGYGTLLYGWITLSIGWVLNGASLWATFRGCGVESVSLLAGWPQYTAAVALATVAGFVSFVPGGAVVRELVLIEVTPVLLRIDPAAALVGALAWRVVSVVAEVAISAILYACGPRRPADPAGGGQSPPSA